MRVVRSYRGVLACCVAALLQSCGPSLYTAEMTAAQAQVERARKEAARWYAPYEYYFAQAHLAKAREEAAEASYEEAIRFARTAGEFGERALQIARRRRASE